jgi:YesN/AraC family two-component response regulator
LEFAQSGVEALSVLDELKKSNIPVPLVITDQKMPGIKGNELISRLADSLPSTRCIMLTGYADSEELKNLNKSNLLKCFNKPCDNQELMKFVREAMTDTS